MARIGVNALYLIPGGVGGTEIYLRELLAALARVDSSNEYFVFTNRETGSDLVPQQPNFHWLRQNVRARFRAGRILWEQFLLPGAVRQAKVDVLFNPGFTSPLWTGAPCVSVFHDLQHKRHPEHFRWFDLPFWQFLLWLSAGHSRKLIAVSEATRADLERFYGTSREKIAVVHHGVDERLFHLDRSRTERMLLCVSTLHPHKNLERLVRAFARSKRDFKLVLAGMRGFHAAAVERAIAESGAGASVEITGWIPREELYRLYSRAHAFVYPSTFEGFGMPLLEAMAAGIPVACSRIAPLEEVAGDAALFFDPASEEQMSAAIERIMDDAPLRDRLATAGRERAHEFTWEKTARETLVALEMK
jgi:glycosyltransferase involved in cell wall biosynthesis